MGLPTLGGKTVAVSGSFNDSTGIFCMVQNFGTSSVMTPVVIGEEGLEHGIEFVGLSQSSSRERDT